MVVSEVGACVGCVCFPGSEARPDRFAQTLQSKAGNSASHGSRNLPTVVAFRMLGVFGDDFCGLAFSV